MVPSLLGWEMVMTFKTQESRFKRKTTKDGGFRCVEVENIQKEVIRLQKTEMAERL